MRILLVDNDLIFLEFAVHYLQSLGHEVETAKDGLSALDRLQSRSYDVLITDLVMPNIDGGMLAHLVRVDPALNGMRVIVISAVAKEDAANMLTLSADYCIGKGPFARMKPFIEQALEEPLDGPPEQPRILGLEELHRRTVSAELLGRVRRLESVLSSTRDGVILMSRSRVITFVNRAAEESLEMATEELLGKRLHEAVPEVAPTTEQRELLLDRGELKLQLSLHEITEDGAASGEVAFIRDVSQYHADQQLITEQLERQSFLLREIHHRVKNNLAAISNYISLELEETATEDGRAALKGVAAHVDAVMLAHQQLYSASNVAGAPVGDYLRQLCGNLVNIFNRQREVTLETEIDDVVFGLEKSVPLGLTVAEIVTNALKYGLPASGAVLRVELTQAGEGYRLLVRDNGPGFPPDIIEGSRDSLGLSLIEGLAHQLSGRARLYNDNGAVSEVSFS